MHPLPTESPFQILLLSLYIPSGLRRVNAKRRVSVMRCEPCVSSHDIGDRTHHLYRLGFLNTCGPTYRGSPPPPFHAGEEDVEPLVEVERLQVDFLVAPEFVR